MWAGTIISTSQDEVPVRGDQPMSHHSQHALELGPRELNLSLCLTAQVTDSQYVLNILRQRR